jgi:hypothetical protein
MTAKEYLKQATALDKLIQSKYEQIETLDARRLPAASIISQVPGKSGRIHDHIAELTVILMELQETFCQDIVKLILLKSDICFLIESLENFDHRFILTERYLNMKRWGVISRENHLSRATVGRYHAAALETLREKFPDKFDHVGDRSARLD